MGYILRRFATEDAVVLAEITGAAIRQVGLRAYAPEQIAAWADRTPNPAWFRDHHAAKATILVVATATGVPVAYTLLEPGGHVDMLFCHPDHVGHGLGGLLLAELDVAARDAGVARLFTEASELARPVFERAGYTLQHRREFTIGPETAPVFIHNYAMEKAFV